MIQTTPSDSLRRRRTLGARRPALVSRLALGAMFCAALALSAGCGGSTRSLKRIGTGGAIAVLVGSALTTVGRHGISPDRPEIRQPMVAVGIISQVTGLLLAIYALDGLMSQPLSAPPANFMQ